MPKVKPKYEEMQSKIFLLSEALEKSESALEKSRLENKVAIEYMVKQIEKVLDGTAVDSMGNSGANV